MTDQEVTGLLRYRSALTSQPYGADAVTAWKRGLADCAQVQVQQAMTALACDGERNISVPAIRMKLGIAKSDTVRIPEHKAERIDCGCRREGVTIEVCDEHRQLGQQAIAAIREQYGWRTPPTLGKGDTP